MSSFSGISTMNRAKLKIGSSYSPGGRCLQHNFEWSQIVHSIGRGAGHYATAMDGWDYSDQKHPTTNPQSIPAGVPIYLGPSPTRTDKNKNAGDVGWSVGNGIGIFTDANGLRVGPMTIVARMKQTRRPLLGYTTDFLGWEISEFQKGGTVVVSAGSAKPVKISDTKKEEDDDMQLRVLYCDKNPAEKTSKDADTKKNYGSTAVINPITGFEKTSLGLGARSGLQAQIAIANEMKIPILEIHVNYTGFKMATSMYTAK